jgi:Anti-sigma-K factor rskA
VTHLENDRLVLIAIGEQRPDHGEDRHLATCDTCRDETTMTGRVSDLARHGDDLLDLPAPSPGVWDRVAAEAFMQPHRAQPHRAQSRRAQPRPALTARPVSTRPPRQSRARLRLALVAALALVLGIAGTAAVNWRVGGDHAHVVAQADLLPQPAAPTSAHGTVQIIDGGHGRQLRLTMTGMPTPTGYYTVWLFDGGSVMIPVGSPGTAPLNIPTAATDLGRFHIIDISAQRLGQQEHGTSMLQGTLHA